MSVNTFLIDTAGVRRRKNINETVEKFSVVKTLKAIEDANAVLLLIDARENISIRFKLPSVRLCALIAGQSWLQ